VAGQSDIEDEDGRKEDHGELQSAGVDGVTPPCDLRTAYGYALARTALENAGKIADKKRKMAALGCRS